MVTVLETWEASRVRKPLAMLSEGTPLLADHLLDKNARLPALHRKVYQLRLGLSLELMLRAMDFGSGVRTANPFGDLGETAMTTGAIIDHCGFGRTK
jgi:hypothetical protein